MSEPAIQYPMLIQEPKNSSFFNGSIGFHVSYQEILISQVKDGAGRKVPVNMFTNFNEDCCPRFVLFTTNNTDYFYFGKYDRAYYSYLNNEEICVYAKIYFFAGSNLDLLLSGLKDLQLVDYHYLDIAEIYNKVLSLGITLEVFSELIATSSSVISNRKKLSIICPKAKEIIKSNNLCERFARTVVKVKNPVAQTYLINKALRYRLSSCKMETVMKRLPGALERLNINEQLRAIDLTFKGFISFDRIQIAAFHTSIEKQVNALKSKNITVIYSAYNTVTDHVIKITIPLKKP